jgi:hypothetical protein
MNTKENSNIDTIKDAAIITYTKVYKDEIIFTTDLFIMNKSLIKAIIYANILEKYKLHIVIPDDSWIFTSDNSLYKTITIFINPESANKADMVVIEAVNNEIQPIIDKVDEAIEKQEIFEILFCN